jgi:hypothetical protein
MENILHIVLNLLKYPILSFDFNTIVMVHTCCVNELGCSYSGSGVSDVQANESFKSFKTKDESVINEKVLKQVCVTGLLCKKSNQINPCSNIFCEN